MSDIKTLKSKLTVYLVDQLENPPEDGVPNGVLSTAAKMVKDFQHEIEDDDGSLAIQDQKLAKFLKTKSIGSA